MAWHDLHGDRKITRNRKKVQVVNGVECGLPWWGSASGVWRILFVASMFLAQGALRAAPVTGGGVPEADASPVGTAQISTGNRNLDKLLEAAPAGATGTAVAASGAGAKGREPSQASSAPGLREASLQQAIRAEAAAQAEAKSPKRGDNRGVLLGMGENEMRSDAAEVDPTTRRRWDGPPSSEGSSRQRSGPSTESMAIEALREVADYLRTHRLELLSILGLLAALGVIVKLYIRRT